MDLELSVLTLLQFDFDYDFATPIRFIELFIESYQNKLSSDKKDDYGQFVRDLHQVAMEVLYWSDSNVCLYYPAPILSAVIILLTNIQSSDFMRMGYDFGE